MSTVINQTKEMWQTLPPWAKILATTGASLVSAYWLIKSYMNKARSSPVTKNFKKDLVYLYQFPPTPYIVNLSPFCLKLETWLRFAGIKYENKYGMFLRSNEGTLPFVELNGSEYPDSSLAIRDLARIFEKENLEQDLSIEQKGLARCIEESCEQNLLTGYAYIRYGEHIDEMMTEKFFGRKIPWWFFLIMPKSKMSKAVVENCKARGIGKHSRDDVISITRDDLRALSNILGSKKYIFGDKPHRVDCTVFGTLSQIVYLPLDTPYIETIRKELPNLVEYCDRIRDEFFPDWDKICKSKPAGIDFK